MSTAGALDLTPVVSKDELTRWMEAGAKPAAEWRIGTEHEKFGFRRSDYAPLPYEGGRTSILKLFEGLEAYGWALILEDGHPVGMRRGEATVSLEPGGQLELSGAPLENLHQTCAEASAHLKEVKAVADRIGAAFMGLGYAPFWRLDEMPLVPKARYAIMRDYMGKVGRLGREMMFRTCTVQANYDFASEADMVAKLRLAIALQPIVTALFANSPFTEGRPNGWLSYRAHVWADTDPDRTGMLPFVFEEGFGFETYVDWAVAAPMYFVRRESGLVDVSGAPFSLFMEGKLPGLEGERPTISDWEDHLSTLFPEARVKRFIETRGADAGPWRRICALPAFWTGVFYDDDARAAAWDLVKGWTAEDREALRLTAPKLGLKAPIAGRSTRDVARDALDISREGLKRRQRLNLHGESETVFLQDLDEIVAKGRTPAEELLALYEGEWGGDLTPIYDYAAY